MPHQELRFGVSDGAGRCGETWKISLGKYTPDVYLACRALQGTLKVSLHASGEWRIAYLEAAHKKLVEGLPGDRGRVIREWPRPREFAKGSTLAFRIITPPSAVNRSIHPKRDKSVQWIAKVLEGQATECDVIITATRPATGWPGQRGMGTSLVGSLTLSSGETLWVVAREIPMPDFSKLGPVPMGTFFKGRSWHDLRRAKSLRMLAFGEEPDGSRTIFEFAGVFRPTLAKLVRLWLGDVGEWVRRNLRPTGSS